MKRPFFLIGLMVLLAGCAGRKPLAPDPFFGRTAIPPPGTGSSVPQTSRDPYYATGGKLSAVTPNRGDRRATGTSATPDPVASWKNTAGESVPSSAAAEPPLSSAGVCSASNRGSCSPAPERKRIVRVMQPRATSAGHQAGSSIGMTRSSEPNKAQLLAGTSSGEKQSAARWSAPASNSAPVASGRSTQVAERAPQRIILPSRIIDIRDLPDRGTRAAKQGRIDRTVQPASGTIASGARRSTVTRTRATSGDDNSSARPAGKGSTVFSPPLRYGHDPEYGWLRGRLEYSEIAKRWRLRYIPIDGKTDRYGGSVVLGESSLLSGQKQGDFIEVRGRLLSGENDDWGYAPVYEVAELRPIGK